MSNTIPMIVYFVGLAVGSAIRAVYRRRSQEKGVILDRKTGLDALLTGLPGLGMFVLPLIYALTAWLDGANYELPLWTAVVGTILYAGAMWLLWRSHAELGRYWSPTLALREEHALVTSGVFRYIRHPMYAAHWLWGIAQPLLLHNWVSGLSMLVFLFPLYLYRVPREEQMMLEQFGEAYRAYMERTGRIIPRLGSSQW